MNTLEEIWDHCPPTDFHGEPIDPVEKTRIIAHWRKDGIGDMPKLRGPAWRVALANIIRATLVFRDHWKWADDTHWLVPKDNACWRVYSSNDPEVLQNRIIKALHGETRASFFYEIGATHSGKIPEYLECDNFVRPLLQNDRAVFIAENPQYEIYLNEAGDNFRGKGSVQADMMYRLGKP